MTTGSEATPAGRRDGIRVGLVLALVAATFAPGLRGDFVWDDWALVVGAPRLERVEDLRAVVSTPFWPRDTVDEMHIAPAYAAIHRPLVKAAFSLSNTLAPLDPRPLHVVSLGLHLLATAMVFLLAAEGLGARRAGPTVAAVVALLFGIHPTRAEAVGWISGLTDVGMTVCFLSALLAATRVRGRSRAVLVGLASLAAVWCKEIAIVLPIALGLRLWALGRPRAEWAAVSGASAVGVVAAMAASSAVVASSGARTLPGFGSAGLVAGTIGEFVRRTLWPFPATLFPGRFSVEHGAIVAGDGAILLGSVAVSVGIGIAIRALRVPASRPLLADLALFALPLAPVCNLIVRSELSLAADRFLYLPILGAGLLVGRVVVGWSEGDRAEVRLRALALVGGVLALGTIGATSVSLARFESGRALFENEVSLDPDSAVATHELFAALLAEGRPDLASALALNAAGRAHARGDQQAAVRRMLEHLQVEVRALPEREQARLRDIRDTLDALAAGDAFAYRSPRGALAYRVPDAELRAIRRDLEGFVLPHARAHLRTFDGEGARAILRASGPAARDPRVSELIAMSYARELRFAEARAAIEPAVRERGRYRATVEAFVERLDRAEAARSRCVRRGGPVALCDAESLVILGSPHAGLQRLEGLDARSPAAEAIAVRALREDGFADEAAQRLARAGREFPSDPQLEALRRAGSDSLDAPDAR